MGGHPGAPVGWYIAFNASAETVDDVEDKVDVENVLLFDG